MVSMQKGTDKFYVPGYSGYIPGDKWRFGSRSSSEPPPLWRNYNGVVAQQENYVTEQQQEPRQRPQTRRQRLQTAKSLRTRGRSATRPMDTATQFPVYTSEMAIQADVDGLPSLQYDVGGRQVQVAMQNEALVIDPSKRGRPLSRNGQRPLDGRIVNNQRADVLFMPNDPFKGLSSNTVSKRMGRYYDGLGNQRYAQNYGQNGQAGVKGSVFVNDGIPTAGYSGHVPGLRSFVGKPFGDALRVLRDGQQKPAIRPMN